MGLIRRRSQLRVNIRRYVFTVNPSNYCRFKIKISEFFINWMRMFVVSIATNNDYVPTLARSVFVFEKHCVYCELDIEY